MFTSNFNDSNALVEGIYLILLSAMVIVAALSVLFALGTIVCAVLDCHRIKPPNHKEALANHTAALNAAR